MQEIFENVKFEWSNFATVNIVKNLQKDEHIKNICKVKLLSLAW